MSRRIITLLTFLVLLAPLPLFAQTEAGVRISSVEFDDTTEVNDAEEVLIELDEDLGYGLFVNRFWTSTFSTEFAIDRLGAGLDVTIGNDPTVTVGDLEVTVYSATALWHFRRDARVSPYAGIGAAFVTGRFDIGNEVEVEEVDFDNDLTWVAHGGVAVKLTDRVSLTGDARYVAYEPTISDDDGEEESVDLNPLMLSAGVRFRF